jgi:uncharacterized protein YkwD
MKTRKSKSMIIILIAIVGTLLLAAPALAATPLSSYEKQVAALVNKQRARFGLPQLRIQGKLVEAARVHSADMAQRKYFQHDSLSGETWSSRIIHCGYTRKGYRYWKAGENIYYGSGLYSSPLAVVRAWMKSPAHRAVILTRVFRDIGVGAVKTSSGFRGIDGTVWFFTLDVGRRIAQ